MKTRITQHWPDCTGISETDATHFDAECIAVRGFYTAHKRMVQYAITIDGYAVPLNGRLEMEAL